MPEGVKIKGSVMKDPRDWLRTAYGTDAYQAALARLAPDERNLVDGMIFANTWYPIATWDKFLGNMREEAQRRAGEDRDVFNRRFMSETGSAIVRGVYRFVLGLMSPQSVIEKAAVIYNRAYSEGRTQIIENAPGRAVLRYVDASPDIRTNLSNHFPTGLVFAVGMSGVQDVQSQISRDEVIDGKLVYEVTLTYKPK